MVYDSWINWLPEIDRSLVEKRAYPGDAINDNVRVLSRPIALAGIAEIIYGYQGCHNGRHHHGLVGKMEDSLVLASAWDRLLETGSEVLICPFQHGRNFDSSRVYIIDYRLIDRFSKTPEGR